MLETYEIPGLYALSGDASTLGLRFARCSDCEEISYPFSLYGCPKCGATPDKLSEELSDGRARLRSFVTIHVPLAPGISPPQVVGEAEIAPGVFAEIMLGSPSGDYAHGMAVQARPVTIERDGEPVIRCRFFPCEDER